ncbi:hypothetical protein F3Y22_tig00111847pilonHSYRG00102 [Hibiscus syriacus]|uniref:Zinc beta-ribbon domain-containing protein n=1 Tax=Hibiscus syriacus TaxID=106335 RepID=A0A6A2Y747_HIBSY|nr:hypothetical protein F3Y22_tig00111847pilonHSYRG00102 [Hibiscus syriacus]
MDTVGAKRFALKAQNLYPELDGLPQLLATLDVYISADKKINGDVDWYRVLAVQPFADEEFENITGSWLFFFIPKKINLPAPRTVRNDTFWTTCNPCKMHFEYSRVYINANLPCINCRTHFFPVETPAPAINARSKYTPFSDFMQQQKFREARNDGQERFSGISTKISEKDGFPRSGSNINVSSPASFTNEATGVSHSACETLKSGHNESQTDTREAKTCR